MPRRLPSDGQRKLVDLPLPTALSEAELVAHLGTARGRRLAPNLWEDWSDSLRANENSDEHL